MQENINKHLLLTYDNPIQSYEDFRLPVNESKNRPEYSEIRNISGAKLYEKPSSLLELAEDYLTRKDPENAKAVCEYAQEKSEISLPLLTLYIQIDDLMGETTEETLSRYKAEADRLREHSETALYRKCMGTWMNALLSYLQLHPTHEKALNMGLDWAIQYQQTDPLSELGYLYKAQLLKSQGKNQEALNCLNLAIYDVKDCYDSNVRVFCPRCCRLALELLKESADFRKRKEIAQIGLMYTKRSDENSGFFLKELQDMDETLRIWESFSAAANETLYYNNGN